MGRIHQKVRCLGKMNKITHVLEKEKNTINIKKKKQARKSFFETKTPDIYFLILRSCLRKSECCSCSDLLPAFSLCNVRIPDTQIFDRKGGKGNSRVHFLTCGVTCLSRCRQSHVASSSGVDSSIDGSNCTIQLGSAG